MTFKRNGVKEEFSDPSDLVESAQKQFKPVAWAVSVIAAVSAVTLGGWTLITRNAHDEAQAAVEPVKEDLDKLEAVRKVDHQDLDVKLDKLTDTLNVMKDQLGALS